MSDVRIAPARISARSICTSPVDVGFGLPGVAGASDDRGAAFEFVELPGKRAIDVLLALTCLLVLAPSLLLIGLAIRMTSRGPILFSQPRYGLNNRLFRLYKFRTMHFEYQDASGVVQTDLQDDRVTLVGNILRRMSLDELPQLYNILLGDMSFVGPRPHVPNMRAAGLLYEQLVPDYFDRHKIRPGLTGLAQANGFRGPTRDADCARKRIALDLAYIERRSLWLDFQIICKTIRQEFVTGSGC